MFILLHLIIRFFKTEKLLFTINNYGDNNCSNKNVIFFVINTYKNIKIKFFMILLM